MGVPAFFRWLSKYYPLIISNCIEDPSNTDTVEPNPNTQGDREFDCLYLDMNGIIHPCFHPEGVEPPKCEADVMRNIEQYVLRLFNIVRPRFLLFMAIDGVAPRAKMNQQRSRRYRSAKEAANNRYNKLWEEKNNDNPNEAVIDELSNPNYLKDHDSNVITPGTPFMDRLARFLTDFVERMQRCHPAWANINIVISDSSVPGEGEHKIMDFIRSQRIESEYDGNRHHCIYGLDADLIFLGLASHEPYFTIIRENVLDTKEEPKKEEIPGEIPVPRPIGPKTFHFVSLWVLRQYLEKDLKPHKLQFTWNLEYALDDFIFLCFSAGNDFIPSLPGLSIQRGAVLDIIRKYRENLPILGAYLTKNGGIDLERTAYFMAQLDRGELNGLVSIVNPTQKAAEIQKLVNEVCNNDDPDITKAPSEKKNPRKNQADKHDDFKEESDNKDVNKEKLKKDYYHSRFGIQKNEDRIAIVNEFMKGMKWVLNYYLHGCISWDWYYPYYSAPCVSDFNLLSRDSKLFTFERGSPYLPLWQLMSVLPPQSAHCLPPVMQSLMTNPSSQLSKYYPTKFTVDLEGGLAAWKGHVHVPFIDSKIMKKVMEETDLCLTAEEFLRNKFGFTKIFFASNLSIGEIEDRKEIDGPIWGQVTKSDSDMSFFFIQFRYLEPSIDLSWVHKKCVMPPHSIDIKLSHIQASTFYDKGAYIQEDIDNLLNLPLQIPGYIPGSSWTSRQKLVQRQIDSRALGIQ